MYSQCLTVKLNLILSCNNDITIFNIIKYNNEPVKRALKRFL